VRRRLILDGCVLGATPGQRSRARIQIHPDDDAVVAAITVAELYRSVDAADAPSRRLRGALLAEVLTLLPVEPFDAEAARVLGRFLEREPGLALYDLMVAATAVSTDRFVLTTDRRALFERLPGVRCVPLPEPPPSAARARSRRRAAPGTARS
jgi:tRNA(fMet)-specific endonuclease VapC